MRGRISKRQGSRLLRQKRQGGAVIILFAFCLVVMIGILGLAVDSSISYLSKARLSLAADSAVLAAADSYTRDTTQGTDPARRADNFSNAADAYFAANYPSSFLGKHKQTGSLTTPDRLDPPYLQYNAQSDNPLTFARVLTSDSLKPVTSPIVSLKQQMSDANIAMLLDESTSITRPKWNAISDALQNSYVKNLDADTVRVAVIPIGDPLRTNVSVPFDPTKDGFSPQVVDAALVPYLTGTTATCKAMQLAVDQFKNLKDTPYKKNIILLITDGAATDSGESYCTGGLDEYVKDNIHEKHIAMYSVGWGSDFYDPSGQVADNLKCLTNDPQYPGTGCVVDMGGDDKDGDKYCLGDETFDPDNPSIPALTACLVHASVGGVEQVLTH
jgi:Flp pilus assembly protein TadG/uncharacterized protein YegL